jgi:hypothetical protein
MGLFAPGLARIATLAVEDTPSSKTATLYLPMCDKGYPTLKWLEQEDNDVLIDRSRMTRRYGYIPELTFRWSIYVDQISASFVEGVTRGAWGHIIGPGDGQMPSITDLMAILSLPPGMIEISPGPTAGGFCPQSWPIEPIGHNAIGLVEGLEIVFQGGDIQPSMLLGAF